jgi:hydroxyacylglutathione hydrolase
VYALHRSADVAFPFFALEDGQDIDLGKTRIRVLHTPGHTPESVSLVVTDLRRGPDPWFVLTGDTLFVAAVGRPDLPGRARENAGELHDSLHAKLLTLPDATEVYPGHFAGSACGAGMSGKPSSTVSVERRWNPLLALGRDAFVDALTAEVSKPAEADALLRTNRGLGAL